MFFFFFFNDTATTEIYTLSLHDALPILQTNCARLSSRNRDRKGRRAHRETRSTHRYLRNRQALVSGIAERQGLRSIRSNLDRKSTRLNSSHLVISYAVFCLKKKKTQR